MSSGDPPPLCPLVVVTGVGTEIGKTHAAVALTLCWKRSTRVLAWKPIESGVHEGVPSDVSALEQASSFHVQHPSPLPYLLKDPVSPHLASRRAGVSIHTSLIVQEISRVRSLAEGVLIELPGGLFSPCAEGVLNLDLCLALVPSCVVVVALDRLGVLHDLLALTAGVKGKGLADMVFLLNTPASPDTSTDTNREEIQRFVSVPVFGPLPRAGSAELSSTQTLQDLVLYVQRGKDALRGAEACRRR